MYRGDNLIDKIKNLRGSLYRKLRKEHENEDHITIKHIITEKEPLEDQEKKVKTRASQMISILKKPDETPEEILEQVTNRSKNKQKFPKFTVYKEGYTILPKKIDFTKNIVYPLIPPYSYAKLTKDPNGSYTYNVIEPKLTKTEEFIFSKLKEGLVQTIDVSLDLVKKQGTILEFLENKVQKLMKDEYGFNVTSSQYLKIMYYICTR